MLQQFEGNLDHFDPRNPHAGDDRLPVQFFIDAQKQDAESEAEGRPIFKDVEFVKIIIDKDEIHIKPVDDRVKQRWPRQYAAWKSTGANEPGMIGTPLSALTWMSRAQAEELRYFKIFTVEQLAEVPDTTVQRIPGATKFKQQAQAYMMIAREQAPLQKLNDELAVRDEQIKALQEQLTDLASRVPAPETRQAASARRG
jgi:hypothetical protein